MTKSSQGIKPMTLIAAVLVIVLAASYFGYITLPSANNNYPTYPSATSTPASGATYVPAAGVAQPATVRCEVVDSVLGTGITTSTTTVDVVAAENGIFDFVNGPKDAKAQATNPQGMNTEWSEGTELIIMVDCTGNPSNGLDYYPSMYYVKLQSGSHLYEVDMDSFTQVSGAPSYTYRVNTANAVMLSNVVTQMQSSNVYYWSIGKLSLYPRQAAADFDTSLLYNAAVLSSVSDGSSWDDTDAEINANATLSSTSEQLTFQMVGGNANLGWGKHFLVVTSQGQLQEYGSVLIVQTAMTTIGVQKMADNGFMPINDGQLYAAKAFYKVLDSDAMDGSIVSGVMFPTKGTKANWQVSIPVDSSAAAAATAYLWKIWVIDCQNLANVPIGAVSTTMPTAYGFVTSYGVGAAVQATAPSASSGAYSGEVMRTYLTTPS